MEQKPWYQKERVDDAFPFNLWETSMEGFSLHWHERVELVYVLSGELSIAVEGQVHLAKDRDILIIGPSSIHGFSDSASGTRILIIQFGLELFDQTIVDLRDLPLQRSIFERKTLIGPGEGELHRDLEAQLLDLRSEFGAKGEGFRLAIKARLFDFALLLLRRLPPLDISDAELARRRARHEQLAAIFDMLHDGYRDPLCLRDAARAANLSACYFSRFFRAQTGLTFHSYLSRLRLAHAEELLLETDLPVTEIAFQSGFESLKTFNRLFRRYLGSSPSRFRSPAIGGGHRTKNEGKRARIDELIE